MINKIQKQINNNWYVDKSDIQKLINEVRLMRTITITFILTAFIFSLVGCNVNDASQTVDSAVIATDGAVDVRYTTVDGHITETITGDYKQISVAPEGFITATNKGKKITVILFSGDTEVHREWDNGGIRVQY